MWCYNAVGGETTLSGYDSFGQPLQYTVNSEQLFLNGVMLVRGSDYAATTGTTITGLTALSAGDFVEILTYSNFNVATLAAPNITGSILNSQLNKSSITLGSNTVNLGDTVSSLSGLTVDFNNNTYHMARGATNPVSGMIAGDLFWNTTSNAMQVYNGTTWSSFSPPAAPTIGTATDVGTSRAYNNAAATVSFTPNLTGGVATQYFVTSTPGSFVSYGSSSPITITGLASSTQYTFTVTAQGSFGNSPISTATGALTVTSVPQAPTIGTPTPSSAVVSVAFTAGATGGSAITSYTVTSSSGRTATGSSSPISITEIASGTYTYSVTATNANGTSAASNNSAGVTIVIPTVTGGLLASDSTYYYRVFTGNGTLGVSGFSTPLTADILVIAGGGGGGSDHAGGGGGAGGISYLASQSLASNSYTCTVGGGGTAQLGSSDAGGRGVNSQLGVLTAAVGGGGGGGEAQASTSGGSGGGGAGATSYGAGSAATSGQGNAGASSRATSSVYDSGAGGGGAGAVGNGPSGSTGTPGSSGGAGGAGTTAYSSWLSAISNAMQSVSGWATATTSGYIAGGGGGGSWTSSLESPVGGSGGAGGGGAGQTNTTAASNYNAKVGTTNTGSGGGGSAGAVQTGNSRTGAAGGSGLIVVRWTKAQGG
jgi:hypothetical protein